MGKKKKLHTLKVSVELGNNIKKRMKVLNISVQKLGAEVWKESLPQTSEQYAYKLIRGAKPLIEISKVKLIADVLQCSIDELFGNNKTETNQ